MATTLHFLSAHKKVGALRKTLGQEDGTNRSYPLAAKVTVHEETFDTREQGLPYYRDLLAQHAEKGHALYKGLMRKKLKNQSRRGQTDNDALTEFMVLDVDGLELDVDINTPAGRADVERVAESVIKLLPEALHNVSYVAVASSSFALDRDKLSVHIHFLLSSPVSHRQLKIWLDGVNYVQDAIFQKLSLTATKSRVKNVIDTCLGEPARIVYIAPPAFGPKLDNPFNDNADRIVYVKKGTELLDMEQELADMARRDGIIRTRKDQKRRECLKQAGIRSRKDQYRKVMMGNGESTSVLTNPHECTLFRAYETAEFVRYNIGDKKNNAYYVRKDNPEIVFSFIPEEPPFLFHAADPQAYHEHVKKYGEGSAKIVDTETGEVRNVTRDMYIEQTSDAYVTVEYDAERDELVSYKERRSVEIAKEWMKFHGRIPPDPVPPITAVFNPNEKRTLYQDGEALILNKFQPPKMLAGPVLPLEHEPWMRYGGAWLLKRHCPVICEIILNMLGDDLDMFEHFINWLAYIIQNKKKSEMGFFVHGEQGTGKGLFHKKILRPIMGDYTVMNTLENLADDKFNDWLAEPLIVFIDEFNMSGASSNITRVATKLKNYVTEPRLQLRKMQVSMYEVDFYANFMFGSNDIDGFKMHDKRRITMCPKQRRMLIARLERLKEYRDEFDAIIDAELPYFASFLHVFEANTFMATDILVTAARDEVNEASMDAVTRFFDNLCNGNFEPFLDIIDKPTENLDIDELGPLQLAKKFLIANVPHINTGEPVNLHKDDVRMLYQYMSGKPINDVRFGRMLSTHEVPITRAYYAVGHRKRFERRPKVIQVTWKMSDTDAVESLQAEFNGAGAPSLNQHREQKQTADAQREATRAAAEAALKAINER